MKSYKDMDIWKRGVEIAEMTYSLTRTFPTEERFGLSSQMQRAAVSIPSNIAEGYNRSNTKEFVQFIHIAKGSCAELETQLIIAERLDYTKTDRETAEMLKKEINSTLSLLQRSAIKLSKTQFNKLSDR